jgi:hypothetical protein
MIPDATYRIRTSADPPMYFSIDASTGGVVPAALNTALDTQKWQIRNNAADNTYTLTNVGTLTQLSIRDSGDKDDNGNIIYELTTSATGLTWTLESRGPNFVVGLSTDNTCVDFSAGTKLLVWARNDLPNQRWILEQISGSVVPAKISAVAPQAGHIRFYNGSSSMIEGYVSNMSSNPPGAGGWNKAAPGTYFSLSRAGTEVVAVRVPGGAPGEPDVITAGAVVAQPGSVVGFYGYYPHPGLVIAT